MILKFHTFQKFIAHATFLSGQRVNFWHSSNLWKFTFIILHFSKVFFLHTQYNFLLSSVVSPDISYFVSPDTYFSYLYFCFSSCISSYLLAFCFSWYIFSPYLLVFLFFLIYFPLIFSFFCFSWYIFPLSSRFLFLLMCSFLPSGFLLFLIYFPLIFWLCVSPDLFSSSDFSLSQR